ncbi:DM13 domain-containing protein [Rhizobiaceae bacterium]|nr:DM13 domain-containing protein [Rhizobiaceae bacterium]
MLRTALIAAALLLAPLANPSSIVGSIAAAATKSGNFASHKRYKVSGKATVTGNKVTLSGFSTTPGPDLYVYVGNGRPTTSLGKLKRNKGTQSYTLPAGVNPSSVFIHCKRFSSTFGTAKLR